MIPKEFAKTLGVLTKTQLPDKSAGQIQMVEFLNNLTSSLGMGEFEDNELEASKIFDSKVKISSGIGEFYQSRILEEATSGEDFRQEEVFPSVCALLSYLFLRFFWQHVLTTEPWRWLVKHTSEDLSPARLVKDLQAKMKAQSFSLEGFMTWFTEEYVVDQATRVYLEKSRSLYTKARSWFHKEGMFFKRDREREPGLPGHRNARFSSATTILEDLGLVEIRKEVIILTRDGRKLLNGVVKS